MSRNRVEDEPAGVARDLRASIATTSSRSAPSGRCGTCRGASCRRSRVQGLAAEARPAPGHLAVGDHAAAPGGRARGRDGDAAVRDRARPRGEALLHDDGAGRVAPHRGVAEADRAGGRDGRARPVPRPARAHDAGRGHPRGEGLPDAGVLRAPDHPALPHDRALVARHDPRGPLQPPHDRRRHPPRCRHGLRAGAARGRRGRR